VSKNGLASENSSGIIEMHAMVKINEVKIKYH
jgi:hypothetical protein